MKEQIKLLEIPEAYSHSDAAYDMIVESIKQKVGWLKDALLVYEIEDANFTGLLRLESDLNRAVYDVTRLYSDRD